MAPADRSIGSWVDLRMAKLKRLWPLGAAVQPGPADSVAGFARKDRPRGRTTRPSISATNGVVGVMFGLGDDPDGATRGRPGIGGDIPCRLTALARYAGLAQVTLEGMDLCGENKVMW